MKEKNRAGGASVPPVSVKAAHERERPLPDSEKASAYIRGRIASVRDEDLCALFLIDLCPDNPAADREPALQRAAGILAGQFRAVDVVGRCGPGRLTAFSAGPLTEQGIRQKAGELCAALQRAGLEPRIGASLAPGRDMTFEDLNDEALSALQDCSDRSPVSVHTLSNWIENHILSPSGMLSAPTLLENISEGIRLLKVGRDLQPFYVSPSFTRLLPAGEQNDGAPRLCVHPHDLPAYEKAARQAAVSASPVDCAVRIGNDAGWIRCRARLSRLFQTGGGTPILLEITQSAEELFGQSAHSRKRGEWLRMLLSQSDCQLWSVDLSNRMMYILDPAENSGNEPQSRLFRDFPDGYIEAGRVHPDSIPQFKKFAYGLLSGRAQDSANFVLQYRRTSCFGWSAVSYQMLYGEDGRPTEAIGIRENLTGAPQSALPVPACPISGDLLPRLFGFLSVNLTDDRVESLYLEGRNRTWMSRFKNYSETVFLLRAQIFAKEDEQALADLFNRSSLLQAFEQGRRWITVRFRSIDPRGGIQWLSTHINLSRGPGGDVWMSAYFNSIEHLHRCEAGLDQPPGFDPATGFYDLATLQAVVRTMSAGRGPQPRALAVICAAGLEEIEKSAPDQARQLRADMASAFGAVLGSDCVIGQHSYGTVVVFMPEPASQPSVRDRLNQAVLFLRQSMAGVPLMNSLRFITSAACADMDFAAYSAILSRLLDDCSSRLDARTDTVEFPDRSSLPEQPDVHSLPAVKDVPRPLPLGSELSAEEKDAALDCLAAMLRAGTRDTSLLAALEHIGRYYQADRAYILSVIEDDQSLTVPYEWNSESLHGIQSVVAGRRLRQFPIFLRHIRTDTPLYLPPLPPGLTAPAAGTACQFAIFPLRRTDEAQRVLCLENPRRHPAGTAMIGYLIPYIEQEWRRFQRLPSQPVSDLDRLMHIPNLRSLTASIRSFNSDLYSSMGALAVDIPGLAAINDEAGFSYGTRLVLRLSEILTEVFGSDLLFHTKQDEFVVLSPNTIYELFTERCRRVRKLLDSLGAQQFRIGYTWSDNVFAARDLVREAQLMMQCDNGPAPSAAACAAVGGSSVSGKFTVFLQPKVDMRTGTLVGAEALARLVDQGKKVSIGDVVEQMEQDGSIRELDYFVLDQVLSLISRWQSQNLRIVPISANFSRYTLLNPSCPASVLAIMSRYADIPDGMIEIELTETACHIESSTLTALMDSIRQFGPQFSLDDFGSHYSNAAVLTRVHFDSVKIDRSLTNGIVSNPVSQMLVRNIVQICKSCGMTCIAEGVETRAQIDALLREGCQFCQGYYFAKPMSVQAFEERYLLHSHRT